MWKENNNPFNTTCLFQLGFLEPISSSMVLLSVLYTCSDAVGMCDAISKCQHHLQMSTPVFKRKNVRGTRRKRQDLDFDSEAPSVSLKASEDLGKNVLNASKWARYASLQNTEEKGEDSSDVTFGQENSGAITLGERKNYDGPSVLNSSGVIDGDGTIAESNGPITQTDEVQTVLKKQLHQLGKFQQLNQLHQLGNLDQLQQLHQLDDEMPQVEISLESSLNVLTDHFQTNTAYTTLNLEELTASNSKNNTFELKQSYFRDNHMEPISLKSEYADKFGNVSDCDNEGNNEMNIVLDDDNDNDVIMDDGPGFGPGFKQEMNKTFYDLEVSVDETADHVYPTLSSLKQKIDERTKVLRSKADLLLENEPKLQANFEALIRERQMLVDRVKAL